MRRIRRRRVRVPNSPIKNLEKLEKLVNYLEKIDEQVFKSKEYLELHRNDLYDYINWPDGMNLSESKMLEYNAMSNQFSRTISKAPLIKPDNKLLKNLLKIARIKFEEPLGNGDIKLAPFASAVTTLIYMALLNHNQGGIESLFLLSEEKLLFDKCCYTAIGYYKPQLQYDFDRLRVLVEFNPDVLNAGDVTTKYSQVHQINGVLDETNLNEAAYYVALGARQADIETILKDPLNKFPLSNSQYDQAICYAEDYRHEISVRIQKVLLADLIKTVTGYLGEKTFSIPSRDDMASYQPKPLLFPNLGFPLVLMKIIADYLGGARILSLEETEEGEEKTRKISHTGASTPTPLVSTCSSTTFARQTHVASSNNTVRPPSEEIALSL